MPLDEAGCERAEGLVEEIVTTVADAKLERVDLGVYILDAEETAFATGLRVDNGDCSSDTTTAEENVGDTRVADFLRRMSHSSVNDECYIPGIQPSC